MFLGTITRLKSCCCCIPLRIGCLVIGYLETIGNLIGTYKSFTGEDDWEDVILYILGTTSLAIINLLMIWGVHKGTKKLILPWLVIKFFAYLGITFYYGVRIGETFTILSLIEQQDVKNFIIGFIIIFACLIVLAWYTFLCVFSFYKTGFPEVQEAKKKEKKEEDEKDDVKQETKTEKKKETKKEKKEEDEKDDVKQRTNTEKKKQTKKEKKQEDEKNDVKQNTKTEKKKETKKNKVKAKKEQ